MMSVCPETKEKIRETICIYINDEMEKNNELLRAEKKVYLIKALI